MSATKEDIYSWLCDAHREGETHMLVVCDTWDYEDFPVYVSPDEIAYKAVEHWQNTPMSRVMEVYDLSLDIESQLNEKRAWHV